MSKRLDIIGKLVEFGYNLEYTSYGGRGSFGEVWPAFRSSDWQSFVEEAIRSLLQMDGDLQDNIESLADLMLSATTDSMGRGIVIYWRIALEKDHPLFQTDNDSDDEEDE